MEGPPAPPTGLREKIPAGLLDVGAASLGTFLVGFYAAATLSAESLGAYAIFFSAFTFATVIPTQLILVPAEVASLDRDASLRTTLVRQSLRLAAPAAALSVLAVFIGVVVARATVSAADVLALTVGAVLSSLLAPAQDHVRRMLHLAGQSWRASLVSVVKLAGTAAAIGALALARVSADWIPFGALAVGNGAALLVSLVATRSNRREDPGERLRFPALVRSGRWLLVVGLLPAGGGFVAASLVASLASPQDLGFAEASRVLAQPILVLAMGLSAVLGPRAMEAASRRRERDARHISRLFLALVIGVGAAYALLVGFDYGWSPLSRVMAKAYAVPGLLLLALGANVLNAIVFPYRSELVGARREVKLTATEAIGNVVRTGIAGTAGILRAFAIPAGFLALAAVRWIGYRRDLRIWYTREAGPETAPEAEPETAAVGVDGAVT